MNELSMSPATNILISVFLIVVGLFLSTAVSVMAYYFKQLKISIKEYKNLVELRIAEYKTSVETRMKEGEERFEKLEGILSSLKSEVYKDYVTKPDLIRIMGSLEFKFREITELIEKMFASLKVREKNHE